MKILFIYTALPKGGIETFFLRITKKLQLNGHKVKFLFFSENFDEDLLKELKQHAEVFSINDFLLAPQFIKVGSPLLKLLFPLQNNLIFEKILFDINHIHAPDFNSILFTYKILSKNSNIPISTGVYHINEFNFGINLHWNFAVFIKKFLQKLPSNNILFFNEICKEFYNNKFNNKFYKSIVTPIGIEIPVENNSFCGLQNNRVVSIGRLAKWKTYNHHMIEVIYSLKNRGKIFYYDSYGEGDQLEQLEEKVKILGVDNLVKFHPGVPYSKFREVIKDKLMFIGAGTAIIEASSAGLPSMIGIENEEKPVTFGFLSDTNTYSYQENQLSYERKRIEDLIVSLKNSNPEVYHDECRKAALRAQDFSIDKTYIDFMILLKRAKPFKFHLGYFQLIYIVGGLSLNKICFPKTNYSTRL